MNSRDKGKRGEREFASLLRENGFEARRGQQFSGSPDSPDVVSEALAWLHVEVKRVQKLNLTDACAQAERDSKRAGSTPHPSYLSPSEAEREGGHRGKPWVVAHRRNHAPWLITMRAEFFFELIREFEPRMDTDEHGLGEDGNPTLPHPGPLPPASGPERETSRDVSAPSPRPSPPMGARVRTAHRRDACATGDGAHGVTRPA